MATLLFLFVPYPVSASSFGPVNYLSKICHSSPSDILLDDLLIADNSPSQSEICSPVLDSERTPTLPSSKSNQVSSSSHIHADLDERPEIPASGDLIFCKLHCNLSVNKKSIVEASIAEAEAASVVQQASVAASTGPLDGTPVLDKRLHVPETLYDGSDTEKDVRLYSRAVVAAKKTADNLGRLVRQLSLDQFVNKNRRLSPMDNDPAYPTMKYFTTHKSPQGLHEKIISALLRPRNWKAPANRRFFLDSSEVGELCYTAEQIFIREPTVLQLKAPVKVFGDLHGQFGDLMRLFDEYGFPSTAGDLMCIDYLFLGDYIDHGQHSLETITLLLALKIEYPGKVHLIRGNHETAGINSLDGFRHECIERMGENDGIRAWIRFNRLFNFLPLAALIEKKIICLHGGIGRSINSVEQIEKLERPITMDAGSIILKELLWSGPTVNDSIEGLRPSARGPGFVTFGPDRVTDFCKKNKLQLIIRAHECVMNGFKLFAKGKLITLFSATNYCGSAKNAGAILVVGRELVVVPKLIHPLPPPEGGVDHTWMQVVGGTSQAASILVQLPLEFIPYIDYTKDNLGRGHCGFRAIAEALGFGEDYWSRVRKDLSNELSVNRELYTNVFNEVGIVNQMLERLNWYEPTAPRSHWFYSKYMGYLVASAYNVAFVRLDTRLSVVYLPLRTPPPLNPKLICTGNVDQNHLIQVVFNEVHPIPPVISKWETWRYSCASGWKDIYTSQLNMLNDSVGNT